MHIRNMHSVVRPESKGRASLAWTHCLLHHQIRRQASRTRRGGGVEELAGLMDFRNRESPHLKADCIMRDAENTQCAKENYNMQPLLSHGGLLLAAPVRQSRRRNVHKGDTFRYAATTRKDDGRRKGVRDANK